MGRDSITPPGNGSSVDAALVAAAREGDPAAFDRLVRRHLGVVYEVAWSISGSRDDAEDLVQEAFVAALEKLDALRDPSRFRGWVLAMVRNRGRRLARRESRKETWKETHEGLDDTAPSMRVAIPSTGEERSPEVILGAREIREGLARGLEGLSPLQQKVVVMHDLEGWSHAEIAAELGISAGASRVHLHGGRRRLQPFMKPFRNEGEEATP